MTEANRYDAFNLTNFDEVAERARLIPVGGSPSPKMQADFETFAQNETAHIYVPHKIRTVPQKLFYALRNKYIQYAFPSFGFERNYHREPDQDGFSMSSLSKRLRLSIDRGNISTASIAFSSEQSSGADDTLFPENGYEGLWISFREQLRKDDMSMGFEETQVQAFLQGEKLQVEYANGELEWVIFCADQKAPTSLGMYKRLEQFRPDGAKRNPRLFLLEDVLRRGKKSLDLPDGHYDIEMDADDYNVSGNGLKITRTIGSKSVDSIVIPIAIHEGDIFKQLVRPELLSDPYCDPTNPLGDDTLRDSSWKEANLASFGIHWQRNPEY